MSARAVVGQRVARLPFQVEDGGASPTPRLQHAEWEVWRAARSEAVREILRSHYSHSSPNTATYAFELVRLADWVRFGSSIWIPPTRSAAESMAGDGWQGVLACSRLACSPDAPKNAASFLLAHSRRQINRTRWPILVSYADTAQGHTGAIYKADGWVCDGPVAAGDIWIGPNGEHRGRKRGPRTLKADEMRALGFVRQASAPKIRFRHVVGAAS